MSTYRYPVNYRKIYEDHYGPIPREDDGRSYEIHHIDGDHNNNHYSNLKAVTLEEHYNIHYAQGDYGACFWMATQRMNKSHSELSALASKRNSKRNKEYVELGIHNFLGGEIQREHNQRRLADGTHHLLGGKIQRKIVAEGRHNLVGPDSNLKRIAEGTHPSQMKLCCLGCKKTTHVSGFKRSHSNCKQTP